MFWICAEKQVANMEMFFFLITAEQCLHSIKAFYASHTTPPVRTPTMGHGISSANSQSLWRPRRERSPFLARQCSWFSWLSLVVTSRVEVCLWFLKVLFEMLNRKSFSWSCPVQLLQYNFLCMVLSMGYDQSLIYKPYRGVSCHLCSVSLFF